MLNVSLNKIIPSFLTLRKWSLKHVQSWSCEFSTFQLHSHYTIKPVNHFLERKDGNILFNDTRNTFLTPLYGVGEVCRSKRMNYLGLGSWPCSWSYFPWWPRRTGGRWFRCRRGRRAARACRRAGATAWRRRCHCGTDSTRRTRSLRAGSRNKQERERNVLFNDALNTCYLRLYGVRHMVKDHSDSEKGNPLLPHRLLLSIDSKGSFICTIPQTG